MIGKPSGCKEARQFVVVRECVVRRLRVLAVAAMLGSALQPLSAHAAGPEEQAVTLLIANEGQEPLRCMILFAHFLVMDVGQILPSGDLSIAMFRQDGDGALWIPRADGRRMMIETIDCGAVSRWAETRGQISLLPARAGRDMHYSSRCRLNGTVVCGNARAAP